MPPRKPKITLSGLQFVRKLKSEIRDADRLDHITLSHRLPVSFPDGSPPTMFTVDLTPSRNGQFIVTCRELPGFVVSGEDEHDALMKARQRIWHLLAGSWRPDPS